MKTPLFPTLALAATIVACSASAQITYSVIDLGVGNGWTSQATGVNNSGVVVGNIFHDNYGDGSYTTTAFRYSLSSGTMQSLRYETDNTSGTYASFGPLAHHNTNATAINNAGQIAGSIDTNGYTVGGLTSAVQGGPFASVYDANGMLTLYPNAYNNTPTVAYAINSNGEIAGLSGFRPGNGATKAGFTDTPGSWVTFGGNGDVSPSGRGINDSGQVVGNSSSPVGTGFLYSAGLPLNSDGDPVTDLHNTFGGSDHGTSNDINNGGMIVGGAPVAGNAASHAYSRIFAGEMTDLSTLVPGRADAGSEALAVNDSGMIVGTSFSDFGNHAFIYTAGTGMLDLNSLLTNTTGLQLEYATAISENGYIAGYGYDYVNDQFGYPRHGPDHAFLLVPDNLSPPSVPETGSTLGLMLLAAGLLVAARSHLASRLLTT